MMDKKSPFSNINENLFHSSDLPHTVPLAGTSRAFHAVDAAACPWYPKTSPCDAWLRNGVYGRKFMVRRDSSMVWQAIKKKLS